MLRFLILVVLLCSFFSCANLEPEAIVGTWQSLNDRYLTFQFTRDGHQVLLRLNPENISDTLTFIQNKYEVISINGNRLGVLNPAEYGDDTSAYREVELKNENRLVMYIYKHHKILDLADEFARTSSSNKFDSIMYEIMKVPDMGW